MPVSGRGQLNRLTGIAQHVEAPARMPRGGLQRPMAVDGGGWPAFDAGMDPRDALQARLDALDAEDAAGHDATRPVTLDQQSTGRLTRMDALQNQAMAQAQVRRRAVERQRILAALKRIDEDEWGFCADCGEEIEPARLAADPAIPLCRACMAG